MKLRRYIALHERVVTRFPWTVISADDGKPALWQRDAQIARVPLRFRSEPLAKAAAYKLNAEAKEEP